MFKRINSKENKENRWPCIICDEWSCLGENRMRKLMLFWATLTI